MGWNLNANHVRGRFTRTHLHTGTIRNFSPEPIANRESTHSGDGIQASPPIPEPSLEDRSCADVSVWHVHDVGIGGVEISVGVRVGVAGIFQSTAHVQKRAAALRLNWKSRRRYQHTDETDAIIRRAYHLWKDFGNRQAIALAAKKLGWPKWIVTSRASKIGLARIREKPWTAAEETFLEKNGWMSEERIAIKMKAAGYSRSRVAIHLKLRRLKIKSQLDGWSGRQLAVAFGIDDHAITIWINRGLLKSRATGITCGRNEKRFIHRDDVRRFILHHPEEIDITKCEKYFLLDVVSGGKLCHEFRREVT